MAHRFVAIALAAILLAAVLATGGVGDLLRACFVIRSSVIRSARVENPPEAKITTY